MRVFASSNGISPPVAILASLDHQISVDVLESAELADILTIRRAFQDAIMTNTAMSASDFRKWINLLEQRLLGADTRALLSLLIQKNSNSLASSIEVISTGDAAQALLWEFLQLGSRTSSGRGVPIARIVPTASVAAFHARPLERNLTILMVTASPSALRQIPVGSIVASLTNSLSVRGVQIATYPPTAADRDAGGSQPRAFVLHSTTVQDLISAVKSTQPHILHFVGHGTREGIWLIDPRAGKPILVSSRAFHAQIRESSDCRLVILGACDTGNPEPIVATDPSIEVFAADLIRYGVPAVVANQFPVSAEMVTTFGAALYNALFDHRPIDAAVAAARQEVIATFESANRVAVEAGTPVLYRHSSASELFP